MRFPLIMTAIILLIGFVTDLLIYKSICRVGARPLWRKIYAVTSVLFALFWIVLICLPKRTGSDGSFERLMWCIYAYASFYIPKYIYAVFDLIAGTLQGISPTDGIRYPGSAENHAADAHVHIPRQLNRSISRRDKLHIPSGS